MSIEYLLLNSLLIDDRQLEGGILRGYNLPKWQPGCRGGPVGLFRLSKQSGVETYRYMNISYLQFSEGYIVPF